MACLSISLLGTFEVVLAGEPVNTFEYDKVRALLAYLTVESDRPHRRDTLTGLLWPEQPERKARQNLSQALFKLRQAIGDREARPPFLIITPQTLQFNPSSDYQLDVTALTALLTACQMHDHRRLEACQPCLDRLQQTVTLYRGVFLEGFSLDDSPAFEEWVVINREHFHRQIVDTLHRLADSHEQRTEYESALQYAWRRVELDPWQEEAHRQLMRLLAFSGQRGTALVQYETCRCLLAEELGLEPAEETTGLYEQIRDGTLECKETMGISAPGASTSLPPFLLTPEPPSPPTSFVARERELAQLGEFLDKTLTGRGQVVFVTGGTGRGKTALIQEFARRVQVAHSDLIVAGGNGNAHTGLGDPYLPFREVLSLLTGDVEARWVAGSINQKQARRLWNLLPLGTQALLDVGPDLIDTFLPGTALLQRAKSFTQKSQAADWLAELEELVERKAAISADLNQQQQALFEQYTRVLETLADHSPVLLVLDDLQWADAGSISLLFHLGRRLTNSRILIVGAYRPTEVTTRGGGERHPLPPVVNEFKRYFGDIEVDLSQTEGRQFVDAFLDTESNRLDNAFREILYRQTKGHPLFTVELLRGMQERGDLVQDQQNRWLVGPTLDWETLPARVEAVIAERIERLPERLQDLLSIASVEGQTFTGEVVAQVGTVDQREMVRWLSSKLEKKHRLVNVQGIRQIEGQRLSLYRFWHILYQRYVYNGLDPVERAYLHEAVGTALEGLYGEGAAEIAVQLARHFQEAGKFQQAIDYLYQAGDRAVRLSANEEAIAHFTQALELLERLPDTPQRAQQELTLQIGLATPLQAVKGYGDPELGRICARAQALSQQIGETPQLFPVLVSLAVFYTARAEHLTAREIANQLPGLAGRVGDPTLVTLTHFMLGWNLFFRGEFTSARFHAEQMMTFYDPRQHGSLRLFFGQDPGVVCLAFASWALWLLGYPEQALKRSREAIIMAQELSHPLSLAVAQGYAALLHVFRRDVQSAQALAEDCINLSSDQGFSYWLASGAFCYGWSLAEQGQHEAGLHQMRQSITDYQATGTKVGHPHRLARLAEMLGEAGQIEQGLNILSEALTIVQQTEEYYYESEIHRLRGELLRKGEGGGLSSSPESNDSSPEACFLKAVEVARRQSAKSLELRAVTSLCWLWYSQGAQDKIAEAQQMLEEVYGWFTEGFETIDLKEAKALLEELS